MSDQIKFVFTFFYISVALILNACSNNVDYTPPAGNNDMAITHYSFGKVVINGETYNSDLVISAGEKINGWSFDYTTHQIEPSDIKGKITENIKEIIIGIGYNSAASMSSETLNLLEKIKSKGILVRIMSTSKAVKLFNASKKKGLLAFFHLNC